MQREEMMKMDEVEVVLRKFGDEQSTLFDRYERLSFEVQLNQAILGRSLSESSVVRNRYTLPLPPLELPPPPLESQVAQGRCHHRGLGFRKMLKKFLKPILRKKLGAQKEIPDEKDFRSFKALKYSRSVRYL